MRTGLIADIHGNLAALETVLSHLEQEGVDQIVCLGDVAALGPQPGEAIARLRDLGCPCVLGNTDAWLVPDPALPAEAATTAPVIELTRWCAERLSTADLHFLADLRPTVEIALGGGRDLLAFHASPRSLDDVIAASTPTAVVEEMLARRRADVYAGGHTHVQLMRRLGQRHVVNPGSVGLPGVGPGGPELPVNRDVNWAEYAMIESGDRELTIAFRRVRLDVAEMVAVAAKAGMPRVNWWTQLWHAG